MTTEPEFTAFKCRLSRSLKRMSEYYRNHPMPGLVTPVDAVAIALSDMAAAVDNAADDRVWVGPGEWEIS